MNRFFFIIIAFLFLGNAMHAQSVSQTVNSINEMLSTYKFGMRNESNNWEGDPIDIKMSYSAPIVTITFSFQNYREKKQCSVSYNIFDSDYYTKRDIKGENYHKFSHSYEDNKKNMQIYSKKGLDYVKNTSEKDIYGNWTSKGKSTRLINSWVLIGTNETVVDRLMNGFLRLKTLASESNTPKPNLHILDNADLFIGKPTFADPNNNNKLDANETGCITFIIKNQTDNEAYNVDIYVKEEKKNKELQYESVLNIERIKAHEELVVNIPVKASSEIDNISNSFQINVLYKGASLASNSLSFASYNKSKRVGSNSGSKVIKMKKMSGNTFLISCKVNGLPLDFIFDTGASAVTMSLNEANFMLKNGYLSPEDILGREHYQTASGAIQAGTKVILKKIEINGLVLRNIEASIIHTDNAPLLLGQSALKQLGTIQIDYNNSTLTIIRK
jgi:clan AA aspartic protease (TIGR02281 family)